MPSLTPKPKVFDILRLSAQSIPVAGHEYGGHYSYVGKDGEGINAMH